MGSKLLADYLVLGYDNDELLSILDVIQQSEYSTFPAELHKKVRNLFTIGLGNINRLFPKVGVKSSSTNPEDYISKWLKRYYNAYTHRQSTLSAKPKGSSNDPALSLIVQSNRNYDNKRTHQALTDHNLFMSAENIQGALLEEYINIHAEKDGWIWAEGETMRACDFVRLDPVTYIPELIQIKNRDNTENSSSLAIRAGTQIKKWNRLKTKRKDNQPYPVFQWKMLNKMMKISPNNLMSEDNYRNFLQQVAINNNNLLT
ncbi:SinI family restriction endonuclease (plasmid) [Lactiplantibacillus plantarum]